MDDQVAQKSDVLAILQREIDALADQEKNLLGASDSQTPSDNQDAEAAPPRLKHIRVRRKIMLDDGTVVGEQVLEDNFPVEMDTREAAKILEARFAQMTQEEIARMASLPLGDALELELEPEPPAKAKGKPRASLTLAQQEKLKTLTTRKRRLTQIYRALQQDPELIRVIDTTIQDRLEEAELRTQAVIRAARRRQSLISAGVALVSLIAGWLLSTISPVAAFSQLIGR